MLETGRRTRGQIAVNIIQSYSVMVGFSWERVFDSAVECIMECWSEGMGKFMVQETGEDAEIKALRWTKLTSFILSLMAGIVLAAIVLPAVFWFISPVVLKKEEK